MLILLSPTKTQIPSKKQAFSTYSFPSITEKIWNELSRLSLEDIKKIFKVSDKIALSTKEYFNEFNPCNPAVFTYQGSTFKNMELDTWSDQDFNHAQDRLIILSTLYGPLRPFDGISLYRLDFNTKHQVANYDQWSEALIDYLNDKNQDVISLASLEYEKMIDTDLLNKKFIRVQFLEKDPKGYSVKSTYSKIARGKMTKILIKQDIQSLEEIKTVEFDGYSYNLSLSNDNLVVFTR